MTLVFWTIHQPQRIYYWLAFAFGLLTDADTGAVFGQHALTYCMVVFFTELMSVRLSWLSSIAQSISLIPIFYIPAILLTIEAFRFGNGFGPWSIFAQGLLSVVIWPAWCWLLARRWFLITGLILIMERRNLELEQNLEAVHAQMLVFSVRDDPALFNSRQPLCLSADFPVRRACDQG